MTIKRLRFFIVSFIAALLIPTVVLVIQAYDQLKWEAIHQHQQLARELVLRFDAAFQNIIRREEGRSFSDYEFLNVEGNTSNLFLQRSPLSVFPLSGDIPGLIGYFQIDPDGQLRSPVLPTDKKRNYGIDTAEMAQRLALENELRAILTASRLNVHGAPVNLDLAKESKVDELREYSSAAEDDISRENYQIVFDELSEGLEAKQEQQKILFQQARSELKLENSLDVISAEPRTTVGSGQQKKTKRREITNVAEPLEPSLARFFRDSATVTPQSSEKIINPSEPVLIRTFESEVGSMQFRQLDNGYFVLYRDAWRDQQRFVQGMLIEPEKIIERLIAPRFGESLLFETARLDIFVGGGLIKTLLSKEAGGYPAGTISNANELIYQTRLLAPFDSIEILFSLQNLPLVGGGQIVVWSAVVLTMVILIGGFMLFRLGKRQIMLANQQQDFVSAVSHELKTPLTSIRMYGEILREGWADEERKKSYYDFIYNESERLSRLINNVLQLARMSRREQQASLENANCADLADFLQPLLESQVRIAEYQWLFDIAELDQLASVSIDRDWLAQILINLVDNAIKFSARSEEQRVEVKLQTRANRFVVTVRDYGPGIENNQMKKIFSLFYRTEQELTRETIGTGIGLALVRQLVEGMNGKIDVVNQKPGASFEVNFPLKSKSG